MTTPPPGGIGPVAGDLAAAALTLARRFAAGATLWCAAPEWPSHAHHVAVEFVHPVVVGKRALPAFGLEGADPVGAARLLARPGDVLLVVGSAAGPVTGRLLRHAEAWGLTRLWIGAGPRPGPGAEHVIWLEGAEPAAAARDGDLVMLYHLLWELTQVVFEHPGLLEVPAPAGGEGWRTCADEGRVGEVRSAPGAESAGPGSGEPTGFLYPFIDADERDAAGLVADLRASAQAQMGQSRELRAGLLGAAAPAVARAGREMAGRFARGGRLLTFGNGGSATDAEGAAELFGRPPRGRPLPALPLAAAHAVVTALANDIGFDVVFSRQLVAHARPEDVAMGFSTSGSSHNVVEGFIEAARRGALTVGLAGYGGGAMAACHAVGHCLVVPSDSVHRIQEAQDALVLAVWATVQQHLAGERPG